MHPFHNNNDLFHVGCLEGDVRLVGGATSIEGRIEVCFSNEWGTVCDQTWGTADASVVCRQLGYSTIGKRWPIAIAVELLIILTGVEALGAASFGEGSGRIWLDNIQCTGSERVVMNCIANSTGVNSCTHAQDAGVRCQPGKLLF